MTGEQIKKKLNLDRIGDFYKGRAIVVKNNKRGHVDLNGNITTPIVYDYVWDFQEGKAGVEKNGKWGHVDLDGNITTPIVYDDIWDFHEGRARVRINDITLYINKKGLPIKHEDYYILIKGIF